jgi:HemY protein
MKFGLLVVLVLALGSVTAHFLLQDNGYVLVNFRGYAVEMSVPVLLFGLCLLYVAVRLLARLWQAPRELGEAVARARIRRSGRRAMDGLVALSEGKLARGERLLTRSAPTSGAPVLNYLAAARTAQMQGDRERRDNWLRMAFEQDPDAANAVLLTQAELQLGDGQRELALASLNRILETQPRHPEALRLLARLRHAEQNWRALADLMPALRRLPSIPSTQVEAWTVDAWSGLLSAEGIQRSDIDTLWQGLPRSLRRRPDLVRARIGALVRAGARAEAEVEIRRSLKSEWDPKLVELYAELDSGDASRQLAHLESWLRQRPEDPGLLLAAGRACLRSQLWGKARSYLESSLAIRPTPSAYHTLGQLMLRIGEQEAATEAFRKGLTLTHGGPSDIPRLSADPAATASSSA